MTWVLQPLESAVERRVFCQIREGEPSMREDLESVSGLKDRTFVPKFSSDPMTLYTC